MGSMRKVVRVAAAVIRKEDAVLATQRGYGAYKDWWEFPGGKIEAEETPEEALIREIREELKAKIAVDGFLTTVEYDYPDFHLTMDCFWCHVEEGRLTLLEHEAARWLPLSDLRQVKWLPADVLVVSQIEKLKTEERILEDATAQTMWYYHEHADSFVQNTITADMQNVYEIFVGELPAGAYILDFGCGSGRDASAFLKQGFRVDAVDGSEKLCRKAAELTGISVKQMMFGELQAVSQYDGIWACASILHLPKDELMEVLQKITVALKAGGIFYTSFKYGVFEEMRNGRYFTDFTEETLRQFWEGVPALEIVKLWITQDVRTGREEERWINLLARRI